MLSNKIVSGIAVGVVFVLVTACTMLYINTLSLEKDIVEKDAKITEVTRDNGLLTVEKQRLLNMQKANNEITRKTDTVSKELSGHLDTAISELKTTSKTEKRGNENVSKKRPDTPLDSDIIRVLDDLCNKIRGRTCPNP